VPIEPLPPQLVREVVAAALAEDRAAEDVTTEALDARRLPAEARIVARQAGVLAGLALAAEAFRQLDPECTLRPLRHDGERVRPGEVVAIVRGSADAILRGERVALNFLQRLSGIATLTARFVDEVAGTGGVILDTRKTTPGLRDLEKYAVRCGGGRNHRRDLAEMAMVKDNHRALAAKLGLTLAELVRRIRARNPGIPVEVEVDDLSELADALAAEPDWILLDNMTPDDLRLAVAAVSGRAKLEASGGVTLATVRAIAETGVEAVSVGSLTHSAPALDLSLELELERPEAN